MENQKVNNNNLNRDHRFITRSLTLPLISEVNKIAAYIINHLGNTTYSVSKLKKLGRAKFSWNDNKGNLHEGSISIEAISSNIRTTRAFNVVEFNLPNINCDWLDSPLAIAKPDAPIISTNGTQFLALALPLPFGNKFPISPCIDREGAVYRSMQTPLQKNILRLFNKLVDESHKVVNLDGVWLNDFRMLLNDCVSIMEVTLHQLYFMAQYRCGDMGWKFDSETLGQRENVRRKDKFKWIGKITGRPLNNAKEEVNSFIALKNVRNHLNHFDPPCFAYTVEDTVNWLNIIPDVGRLLWKIREKLKAQLTAQLVEIIMLPYVEFVPRNPDAPRVLQTSEVGYMSSTWPKHQ